MKRLVGYLIIFFVTVGLFFIIEPKLSSLTGDINVLFSNETTIATNDTSNSNEVNYYGNNTNETRPNRVVYTDDRQTQEDTSFTDGLISFFLPIALFISAIILIIFGIIKFFNRKDDAEVKPEGDKKLSELEILKYISDFSKNEFLEEVYNVYLDVQKAYCDFDYEKLKELLSDEAYVEIEKELKELEGRNHKRILSDFSKRSIELLDFMRKDNIIYSEIKLVVGHHDYIVDSNDNLISGNKENKVNNFYILTFERTSDNKWKLFKKENE